MEGVSAAPRSALGGSGAMGPWSNSSPPGGAAAAPIAAVPSSSKVSVAFPGERPWLVERERLFVVVALGEGADAAH